MKKFEEIIKTISEEEAQEYQLDSVGQKIIQINDNTGEVVTGFFSSWRATTTYYLVSNSLLVHRVKYISPKFGVEDKYNRKIEVQIEAEISCRPGNEVKLAQFLHLTGKLPSIKLDRFIQGYIDEFRKNPEYFIENYFTLNLAQKIEDFIVPEKKSDDESTHLTSLEFHSIKCFLSRPPDSTTISINLNNLKVGFNDSVEKHTINFNCKLTIDKKTEINAHSRDTNKRDFEKLIVKTTQDIFDKFISEEDMFSNYDAVQNTLKDKLNIYLQKYGRKILAIKIRDLYIEDLKSKSSFEIEFNKQNLLALDREDVQLKIILKTKIKDIRDLIPHKDNLQSLKKKILEKTETAIKEFIKKSNSGEFFSNIELNSNFRDHFIQAIQSKTNETINAEFIIKDIDIGRKSIIRIWTPFEAKITSQIEGECLITGSFIFNSENPTKQALRKSQKFDAKDIEKTIIETLKAWLVAYPSKEIIHAKLTEPERFEKAIENKLIEKVDAAYGVFIRTQNITTEPLDQPVTIPNIEIAINQLEGEIIDTIMNGGSTERLEQIKGRQTLLKNHKEDLRKAQIQPVNVTINADNTSDIRNTNPLLTEISRLLLEE